jgi:hypothetical protein
MLTIDKNPLIINNMKWQLSQSFVMKDLALTKQILGNRIYEEKKEKLHLSQELFIEKVLHRFNMNKAKTTTFHLTTYIKLRTKKNPSTNIKIWKEFHMP